MPYTKSRFIATTEVVAACHCGVCTFRVHIPTSTLPVPIELCHCNECRHTSGQMAFAYVPFEKKPLVGLSGTQEADVDTHFKSIATSKYGTRFFCGRCSTHLIARESFEKSKDQYYVAAGSIETAGVTKIWCHRYIADTLDGGLADQIREVEGQVLPRFAHEADSVELPSAWRSEKLPSPFEAAKSDRLDAHCFCGQIQIYVTRPNVESSEPHAPFPDLLYPKDRTRLATVANRLDVKWWLGDEDVNVTGHHDADKSCPTRFLAGHCVCLHCRRGSGFEVQSWAFVTKNNLFDTKTGQAIDFLTRRPEGLSQYISSAGRYREFCGKCGATVFWWHYGRPGVIDLSLGLLDEKQNGARAEQWFKWHMSRVSFVEDVPSIGPVGGLLKGMAEAAQN